MFHTYGSQIPVSVIIRCKVAKTRSVENVRMLLALSQMRNGTTMWSQGVSDDPFADMTRCAHLATLRHFDHNCQGTVKKGPLIPWERRLREMEISENQEVIFDTRFVNRDYGRPY